MTDTVITTRIMIDDQEVISAMKELHASHIRLVVIPDVDGRLVISAKLPPSDSLSLGKAWLSVSWLKRSEGFFIRTPSSLLQFTGKSLKVYRMDTNSFGEVFRMRPVNFALNYRFAGKRELIRRINPEFTPYGGLVIPSKYLIDHNVVLGDVYRISFDKTNISAIQSGHIIAFITSEISNRDYSSALYPLDGGFRMRQCRSLFNMVQCENKKISNFKYIATVDTTENPFGIMVFEEKS